MVGSKKRRAVALMAYRSDSRYHAPMGLRLVIEVDGMPSGMELAVKEDLAMALEQRYGHTVRVVLVEPMGEG